MRILKALGFLVLPLLFILSCNKEKSLEIGGALGGAAWEFKESGVDFKGKMDSAYIETSGTLEALFLEGTSNDGSGTFLIQIVAPDITTGTFTSPNLLFQYIVGGNVYYESDPANTGQFTITITNMDSVSISGTFSGEVIDALGAKKTITNGRFSGKLANNNNPPPPPGDGQLMFWAEQLCPGGGNILIKIQGQQANITAASATEPTCGTATGNALFTFPAGNYAFKAFCGTDSTEGVITVVVGGCTSVKITFSGPPTGNQCRIRDIAYYDRVTGTAEGAITSFFNTSNQVNRVQLYDSVAGTVDNNFNISYPPARVQVDPNQYFTLDPSQRVKEWHGKIDPTDNASQSVVVTYQYDALGYMTKALIALAAAPSVTVLDVTYQWTSGNLTKVVISEMATGARTEIEYQYDLSKQARNFLAFLPNSEIIIFQSAINYGKNSTNVPIKSIIKDYDASNTLLNTDTSDFINYIIDANGYIKSFEITGDDSVYGSDTKYVISYKCA